MFFELNIISNTITEGLMHFAMALLEKVKTVVKVKIISQRKHEIMGK